MKVSSEQQAHREAILTVEMDNQDVEPYLDRAYKQVVQRLNIPGFRKGKAPRRIVEQMYGRGYLLNEALDSMVQEVTTQAVQQEELELGGVPSVSIEQFDPPSFKATVPLIPSVDLGDYKSIQVPKEDPQVNEEQVDSVLERLREDLAVWEPVDGPVQLDDMINLTAYGWADPDEEGGERHEIVHSEETDYIPRSGTRFPVPGFDEGLVGLPQGEKKEFTVDVPEDFENKELAGKQVHFVATIHSVKRKSLPELDDEFAKGVGDGFESLEALRERIRENLLEQETRNVEARHQEEVLSKVVEGATVEMSPLIVDHEVDHYLEEQEEKIRTGRISSMQEYQEILATAGQSDEEKRKSARPKVEERLKRAHIIREVVRDQQFEVSDEEIDAEVESMVADMGEEADSLRELFKEEDRRESIRRMLLNRKAMNYLTALAIGNAEGTEAQSKQEAAQDEPEAVEAKADQEQAGGN